MKQWMKRVTVIALMVTLVLGSALGALADAKGKGNTKVERDGKKITVTFEFEDSDEAAWALQYMTSMQIKGVMEGYEGKFQPNRPINRVEAITTAVRILGLESEAQAKMETDLNFKDAKLIEKKYSWAIGYIAVAVEQGLFDASENAVKPNEPASREWTATLLVKALGKNQEALTKMNTQLTFKDSKAISAGAVGYVAVAVENKLVEGYSDGTFKPNKPVTRAEMAALLDRLDGKLDSDLDANSILGTYISSDATTVTLQTYNNTSMTLPLGEKVYVFVDRKQATLADLVQGDEITVRTVDNKAVYISAKIEEEEFEGRVLMVTPLTVTNLVYGAATLKVDLEEDDNTTMDFILQADTKITYDGKKANWTDILVGDEVEVKVERNQVTQVKIEEREELKLKDVTLKSLTTDAATGSITSITVVDETGKEWTFNVNQNTDFELKGVAALQVGQTLEIKVEGNIVTEVKVERD